MPSPRWLVNLYGYLSVLAAQTWTSGQKAQGRSNLGAGEPLTVTEVDGTPSFIATTLRFPNSTVTDSGSGVATITVGGGGGSLTVTEVDGTPSFTATTLRFPNTTVVDAGSGIAAITFPISTITGLGTGVATVLGNTAGGANGIATLDGSSKLTASQLPDLAISDYLGTAANQVAMLALSGQKGDWVVRTDLGTTWIITGNNPTLLADWTQLSYPTAPVTSVASRTGAVVLTSADVGLGSVENAAASTLYVGLTGNQTVAGNKTLTGELLITSSGVASVPARIRGIASQTGNLFELQNSTPTTVDFVAANGDVTVRSDATNGGLLFRADPGDTRYKAMHVGAGALSPAGSNAVFTGLDDGSQGYIFFNAPRATGFCAFRQLNSTVMAILDQRVVITQTGFPGGTEGDTAARLSILTQAAAKKGLTIRGFTSQTGPLFECQDVAATPVFSVGPTGKINAPASTTARASINIPHGVAPTSPIDGDEWSTTAGRFARINGVTVGPFGAAGGTLTVTEVDGTPSFAATTLRFDNGTVTDAGGGVARIVNSGGGGLTIGQAAGLALALG